MRNYDEWIEKLLQAGIKYKYFVEDAYLDKENKKIMAGYENDQPVFMRYDAWEDYFNDGYSPEDAILEDLSNL